MHRVWIALVSLGMATTTFACTLWPRSVPDPDQRLASAAALARQAGFERIESDAGDPAMLPMAAWIRLGVREQDVHLYIEGDGLAWQSRRRVSKDPTPIHPTGLMLAAADSSKATVIYLGRPCQYGMRTNPRCRPRLWSAERFGEAVVDATDRRIDALLTRFEDHPRLILLGYSGGGVVASLVAARREDVDLLVTIAAPLDVAGWTRLARVSRLSASLSPMDEIEALARLPQHHFVGGEDVVVPQSVTEAFHFALGSDAPSRLSVIEDMDHRAWPDRWAFITRRTRLFEDVSR